MTVATIMVDGRAHEADERKNLLEVCLNLGYDLPYFCWHPALGSVGACRQCAVKQYANENDANGRVVMACMTPATEGTRISIADAEATAFRAQVIEWLMESHPHDCPVCDEGGECHLQDMTTMSGHVYREYSFPKQTFTNQQLGPLINHEMNRCIECYRCVRYYQDYAGGSDLDVFASRNRLYFGRVEDGTLENEFAGNLVEICPTGVFTDKTLKQHYTRKWDLQMAPSICTHCAAGCNITAGERYGTLRRVVNRYNSRVNGYFLCDRGRFGYEFVNGSDRIREARGGTADSIVQQVAAAIRDGKRILGIGSARASLESNFALRDLVGADSFYDGVADPEADLAATAVRILRDSPAPAADLTDLEDADAVLVLGEDVTNTIPRWALALRQASLNAPRRQAEALKIPAWNEAAVRELIQEDKEPFFIVSPAQTRLDDVATSTLRLGAAEAARVGFAIAHALDSEAPAVPDLAADLAEWAARAAEALRTARQPVVVSGTSAGSKAVLHAAANIAAALRGVGTPATIALALPAANSAGLALLEGRRLEELEAALEQERADVLLVLESDLHASWGAARADALLDRCDAVVVLDSVETPTSRRAAAVLPAASVAEADGTFVNAEGRAQGFYQVMSPDPAIQESWRWVRDIARAAGRDELAVWESLDDVRAAVAKVPVLGNVVDTAPSAAFRQTGLRIPRQPHRYSGRTAMLANITVQEPKPPQDADSPLTFSMEGSLRRAPNAVAPFSWAPAWNSQQAAFKFQQEIGGELRDGDPGVRLLGSQGGPAKAVLNGVPPADDGRNGLTLTPLYHIFGSEELSRRAPGIAALSPDPYFALHPDDAAAAGVSAGGLVTAAGVKLPLRIDSSLARGLLGYAAGYAETAALTPGAKTEAAKI
jgi:NADH-quinone oxidoreductase subunit G